MNIDIYIAVTGFLLLLCVFANKLSDRFGIPSLLLFLALGMMAGIDGPGGINFQDSRLTNYIGTIALMFILFNGGLLTNWNSVRNELFRGTLLATVGVFLTALFLFLPAYYLLRLPLEISLLLSVIVSSTDAPAVFAAMRTSKIRISPKLKSLLEFESASNDPMAVFLSMAALAYLTQPEMQVGELGSFFVRQMSVGIIFGMGTYRRTHPAKIALALSRTLSRLRHQYRLSDLQPDPAVRRQRNFGGLHLRHHHRQQCFYVPPSSHPLLRFAGLDNANRNVPDFRPAGQSSRTDSRRPRGRGLHNAADVHRPSACRVYLPVQKQFHLFRTDFNQLGRFQGCRSDYPGHLSVDGQNPRRPLYLQSNLLPGYHLGLVPG